MTKVFNRGKFIYGVWIFDIFLGWRMVNSSKLVIFFSPAHIIPSQTPTVSIDEVPWRIMERRAPRGLMEFRYYGI